MTRCARREGHRHGHQHRRLIVALGALLCLGLTLPAGQSSARKGGALAAPAAGVPPVDLRGERIKPGTWARYALVDRARNKAMLVRFAVLQREAGGQWFELGITDEQRRRIVFKTLLQGPSQQPKRVLRAVVQPPHQRPLLLPDKLAQRQLPPLTGSGDSSRGALVGRVTIKVAGGTFRARHYRRRDRAGGTTEAWLSDEGGTFPLVKLQSPSMTLELQGHGTNATSQVQGQPVRLDPAVLRQLGLID